MIVERRRKNLSVDNTCRRGRNRNASLL